MPESTLHSIHTPEKAEALPAWAEIKYTYGHILEALSNILAKTAGHEVTRRTSAITFDGILRSP